MSYTGTQSFAGRGTQLEIGNVYPSPTAYISIGELKKVDLSGTKGEMVDVTNMQSGRTKEWLSTLLDTGEIKLDGSFHPNDAGQQALQAALDAGGLFNFKVVFASSSNGGFDFTAFTTAFDVMAPVDKEVSFTSSLKVSGLRDWTSTP